MCCGNLIKDDISIAKEFLDEANNALKKDQYIKASRKIEHAIEEIKKIKDSINNFVKKEFHEKAMNFFEDIKEYEPHLQAFNDILKNIQDETSKEVKDIIETQLLQKEFIKNYIFDINFAFYIGEDDSEYTEDDLDSNILFELNCGHTITPKEINDEELDDYNDPLVMTAFKQCYLFHSIYHHIYPHALSWKDILRVKKIDVEIQMKHKKHYKL
ncbi:MAG: hypothetical protein HQK79_18170 [Desulfobacterales bacterium]|nr:hypothetical protein [Desulfobacterales bacterium]